MYWFQGLFPQKNLHIRALIRTKLNNWNLLQMCDIHTWNPIIWEVYTVGMQWIPGQPGPQSRTLSQSPCVWYSLSCFLRSSILPRKSPYLAVCEFIASSNHLFSSNSTVVPLILCYFSSLSLTGMSTHIIFNRVLEKIQISFYYSPNKSYAS